MCHVSCLMFGETQLTEAMITNKTVLEVGSKDLNGSLRPLIEEMKPKEYIGVDIEEGRGVDEIVNAEDLIDAFGVGAFDLVVCTELMEHVENWQDVIHNLKGVVKTGGCIILTTRGPGFPKHDFPYDYWRYTVGDILFIFQDMVILRAEDDWETPGVFLLAFKPSGFKEHPLIDYKLTKVE